MDDCGVLDVDVLESGPVDGDADRDGGAVGGHGGHVVQQDEGERPTRHVHDEGTPPVLVRAVQALRAKSGMNGTLTFVTNQADILFLKHDSRKIRYFWVVRKFKVLVFRSGRFGLLPAAA